MTIFRKINRVFEKREKIKYVFMLLLIIVGALVELLGVSIILPYIQMITDPSVIESKRYLQILYSILQPKNQQFFLGYISLGVIMVFFIKNIFLFFMYFVQYKLVYSSQMKLSIRLMNCYMKKPYSFHLQKNSSEIVRSVINDTGQFIQVIMNALSLISEILVTILLSLYLIILDPVTMLTLIAFLGLSVVLYFQLIRKKIRSFGKMFQDTSGLLIKAVNQALGGLKDMKVMHREEYFVESYAKVGQQYVKSVRGSNTLNLIPKYSLEFIAMAVMLGIVSIKLFQGGNVTALIPQLSAFAVAAIRLLPAVNRINNHINTIAYYKPSIDLIYHDIMETEDIESVSDRDEQWEKSMEEPQNILIRDLSFHYADSERKVLEHINLILPLGKSIGIVGSSGAGKTTLVDILLGVLEPSEGEILYGDLPIRDYPLGWSKKLGYIPQSIFLTDDTIRNNIAFGIREKEIDESRIQAVIQEAQLEDLISSQPNGLDTVIGERGVRISGGQRQRIGIARALYHNPEILVLDEATSALDNETEKAVMEAINMFQGKKTLIIIAHRLSTISNCEYVYEIKDGKANRTK